jgi:apolipoprotein N-acyltransferase
VTQSVDQEIDDIIAAGQIDARQFRPLRPVVILSVLSLSLLWLCFTPLEIAPAAWIALVPFCVLMRTPVLSRRQYLVITLCGWVWSVATLQWMRLGHPAMYIAMVALGFYMSLYFPLFIGVSRRLMRSGIPLWLTVPAVWTSLEFLRAWLMTGFAWYFLGHSQYRWIELIQIADLTGVYGITFLTAMSSAIISELIPDSMFATPKFETPRLMSARQRLVAATTCGLLVVAAVIYGWQRQQSPNVTEGPVIALVQGHFPPEEKHNADRSIEIVHVHDMLTRRAAEQQPDLIVWPETMWPAPVWTEDADLTDQQIMESITAQRYARPEPQSGIWHDDSVRAHDNFRNVSRHPTIQLSGIRETGPGIRRTI